MVRKGTLSAMALGLVFVALPAGRAWAGLQSQQPKSISFNYATMVRGPIKGVVVARQTNSNVGIRVTVSLHGVMADRRYRISGSAKPCSQVVDAADLAIWRANALTGSDSRDWFFRKVVRRHGKLSNVRSVRIFDLDNVGGPEQVACAKNEVAIESIELAHEG